MSRVVLVSSLTIAAALAALGAGGKVAYDRYSGTDSRVSQETPSPATGCSLCAVHKADLELMRKENEKRSLLRGTVDSAAGEK